MCRERSGNKFIHHRRVEANRAGLPRLRAAQASAASGNVTAFIFSLFQAAPAEEL